jgi:hypothetical protein
MMSARLYSGCVRAVILCAYLYLLFDELIFSFYKTIGRNLGKSYHCTSDLAVHHDGRQVLDSITLTLSLSQCTLARE